MAPQRARLCRNLRRRPVQDPARRSDSKSGSGVGVCTGVTTPIVASVAYVLDVASGMADAGSRLQDQNDFWIPSLDRRPKCLFLYVPGEADSRTVAIWLARSRMSTHGGSYTGQPNPRCWLGSGSYRAHF